MSAPPSPPATRFGRGWLNILEIIEASVSLKFHKDKSRTITNSYMQQSGTRGYVSFIPTYDCK